MGNELTQTYEIESQLGAGGSGAVYKAWHKRLRKHLVIKEQKDGTTKEVEAHRNEIEALKNIKSMYIPQVFDFLMEESSSFTVMEYIDGDSFDKLLKAGRMFSKKQLIKWYYQLACALQVIHRHDVCHRDIKPSNIMLTQDEDACLIDFNSAFVSDNNTKVVNRSLGYASPEQYMYFELCVDFHSGKTSYVAEPQRVYNGAYIRAAPIDWKLSDIYSLGATMFHLVTGKRPPELADEKTIALSLDDSDLGHIIKRSMQATPDDRFSSATELCKALAHCFTNFPAGSNNSLGTTYF